MIMRRYEIPIQISPLHNGGMTCLELAGIGLKCTLKSLACIIWQVIAILQNDPRLAAKLIRANRMQGRAGLYVTRAV
jgi:hypothetical protein